MLMSYPFCNLSVITPNVFTKHCYTTECRVCVDICYTTELQISIFTTRNVVHISIRLMMPFKTRLTIIALVVITLNVPAVLRTIKRNIQSTFIFIQQLGNTTTTLSYYFLFCSGHFPDFTCRVRCWTHLNPWPQEAHLNGSSSLCRRLCARRFLGLGLLYGHSSHLNCFLL